MGTVLVILEPLEQVVEVPSMPALATLQQSVTPQHLLAANLADKRLIPCAFPLSDALLRHLHALQKAAYLLDPPLLLQGLLLTAPLVVLEPFQLSVLAR